MSSSYHQSTPWRRASVMSPVEIAQSQLKESERTFSQTEQQLHQAIRTRAATPVHQFTDISAKDKEITDLQQQLRQQETEMQSLRTTIERQKMTIKTQSDTIQNPRQHFPTPRGGNQFGPGNLPLPPPPAPIFTDTPSRETPSRQAPFRQTIGQHQRQESSPFNGPYPQQPLSMRQQPVRQPQGPTAQPTPVRPSRHVDEFGSPEAALMQGFNRMNLTSTPRGSGHSISPTPASSATRINRNAQSNSPLGPPVPTFPTFNPSNGMALTRPMSAAANVAEDMASNFAEVIYMTETFSHAHVNIPSTHKDAALPQDVKDRLLSAGGQTTAFGFMSTPYTRYFLVTKIIFQYLCGVVFKYDCFAGFDAQADNMMDNCKQQMYQTTPAQIKFQLLNKMSAELVKMTTHTGFQAYIDHIARARGNELWQTLKPLMHQKTSRDWEDLYDLMLKAHELARRMYSGSEEYKFDFPLVGQRFRQDSMEPREPYTAIYTADELEARGATVRLGYTPLITSRTSTAAGYVNSQQLMKAFVLLKNDR